MAATQSQFEQGLKARMEEQLGYEGVTLKDVRELLDGIGTEVGAFCRTDGGVRVRGVGTFSTKKKPATKKRKGINPFTKEEQEFAAKPASTSVKVRPAKGIKDAVARR